MQWTLWRATARAGQWASLRFPGSVTDTAALFVGKAGESGLVFQQWTADQEAELQHELEGIKIELQCHVDLICWRAVNTVRNMQLINNFICIL